MDMAYATAGALTGFVVGITGVGGGALMTPMLLLFFGISPTTAIATDLWFASITKLVGGRIHNEAGLVEWQVVKRLWMGSLPVALLAVGLISMGHQLVKMEWLNHAIGTVILITAAGLLLAPRLLALAKGRRLGNPEKFKRTQPGMTVLAGAVLGLCVALTSVGAGALGSVMLLYLYPLRMTPHRLVATDLVHAIPLAMTAGIGYLMTGMVDWWMLANLLLGSIPAVILGSMLATRLPGRSIQILLALILAAAGAKVIV